MNRKSHIVTCGKCRVILQESADMPSELRLPCAYCGSQSRQFKAFMQGELRMKSKLQIKGRRGGKGKPFIELIKGDSLSTKLERWMKKVRIIDRENDWYSEIITDPDTGETIHWCEEPLSKHKGYGSAKKNT